MRYKDWCIKNLTKYSILLLLRLVMLSNVFSHQKSGVILTSMEPNFFSMLFSFKNQKFMMLWASCFFGGPKNLFSPWIIDMAGYYWKPLPKAFSVITSHVNISWREQVFWPTKGTGSLQHHKFSIFDGKQHPKKIWFRGC